MIEDTGHCTIMRRLVSSAFGFDSSRSPKYEARLQHVTHLPTVLC